MDHIPLDPDPLGDDLVFLDYVDGHSCTERALFSVEQVSRLLRLAGITPPRCNPAIWHTRFVPVFHADAVPLIRIARANVEARRQEGPSAKVLPFRRGPH